MTQSTVTPPVARPEPTPTTLHGQTLENNYRWMRDKSSSELIAYLTAENGYTTSLMKPTEDWQAKLYTEMLSHIKETDESVPYRDHGWYYYTRTVEGSQYPIHCRRVAVGGAYEEAQPEQVILDVNQLAEGQQYMSVGLFDRQYGFQAVHAACSGFEDRPGSGRHGGTGGVAGVGG